MVLKNQKKIKSLEKSIQFFPNIDYFKEQLALYEWADLLDIEVNGSYYPRFISYEKYDSIYAQLLINENCYSFIDYFDGKHYLCFVLHEYHMKYDNKSRISNNNKPLIDKFKTIKCRKYRKYSGSSYIFKFDLKNGKEALKIYNDFFDSVRKGD